MLFDPKSYFLRQFVIGAIFGLDTHYCWIVVDGANVPEIRPPDYTFLIPGLIFIMFFIITCTLVSCIICRDKKRDHLRNSVDHGRLSTSYENDQHRQQFQLGHGLHNASLRFGDGRSDQALMNGPAARLNCNNMRDHLYLLQNGAETLGRCCQCAHCPMNDGFGFEDDTFGTTNNTTTSSVCRRETTEHDPPPDYRTVVAGSDVLLNRNTESDLGIRDDLSKDVSSSGFENQSEIFSCIDNSCSNGDNGFNGSDSVNDNNFSRNSNGN